MKVDAFIDRLESVRSRGTDRYSARCPAHADTSPSLAITEGERGLLVKCWAGCTLEEITAALGLRVTELFYDAPIPRGTRPAPRPARLDLRALAFQFELAGLDRRLRAAHVFKAIDNLSINELSDEALDQLLDAAGRAYADRERADLLEVVADDLRFKDFARRERTDRHAA